MKKKYIASIILFATILLTFDFFNLSKIVNGEFPANTYKNALYISQDYIKISDFIHNYNEYITLSGLSHELAFIDVDGGVIIGFAYESNAFRKNYFTKEVFVNKRIAMECLDFAIIIYEDRDKDYKINENIIKKGFLEYYSFNILFSNPEYIIKDEKLHFVISLKDFNYTFGKDNSLDYLDDTEYLEFLESSISIVDINGNTYSEYSFEHLTGKFIFKIEADSKIKNITIRNVNDDYLIGGQFERVIIFEDN